MKIAFYVEDGLEQIVLTPEGDLEKDILGKIQDADREMTIHTGSFYECRGGFVRQANSDTSTIIVMRKKIKAEPE